ncbi:aconitase X [Chloroflexota bacterium]
MNLTDEQKRMYDGEYGLGFQKAINMLIEYGEVWDAERLVNVHSAHTGLGGGDWLNEILEGVDQIRAFTTTHAGSVGSVQARRAMGVEEKYLQGAEEYEKQMLDLCVPKGFIPASTCTPYLVGNLPTAGRIFSWPGSSGIIISNSIFGARGNRDAMPASMVSAVTGLTPDMLLLKKEQRYGQVLFKIEDLDMENLNEADYGAIGYYIGGVAETKNVVVEGIPQNVSFDKLKSFLTPQPVSGAVAMCHIIGVTPEAPTVEEALGYKQPEMIVKIGKKELREGWESLHTSEKDEVEVVSFGCPQLGINEMGKIAQLLEGKKIASSVKFVVSTTDQVHILAKRMGYVEIIENAGGIIVTGICVMGFPYAQLETPATTGATNSAKAASYQARRGINIQYGSFEDCINAAITGKWER